MVTMKRMGMGWNKWGIYRYGKYFMDPVFRTLVLVNLAAILEKSDEAILPAVFKEVQQAFHINPFDLGVLSFLRGIVQAVFSPVAAYLATTYNRIYVIVAGIICWSLATFAVGVSTSFYQLAIFRGLNGIGLSVVIPAIQSIVADSYNESERGWGFGLNNMFGTLGMISGTVFATLMSGTKLFGYPGWRLSFIVMANSSLVLALFLHLLGRDPLAASTPAVGRSYGHLFKSEGGADEDEEEDEDEKVLAMMALGGEEATVQTLSSFCKFRSGIKSVWEDAKSVMRLPTFLVIVAQGVVGSFPWSAMQFNTWYFQLLGFSDSRVASLTGLLGISGAFGSLFGGWVGDRLSRVFPNAGRVICAQLSSGISVPLCIILLRGLPTDGSAWPKYAVLLIGSGLLMTWCAPGTNNPIFAEIVPEKRRTTIYAYDRGFEVFFASFGGPAVGSLADVFGFQTTPTRSEWHYAKRRQDLHNADALSKAMVCTTAIPFAFCCTLYSFLYCTYPRDRDRRLVEAEKDSLLIFGQELEEDSDGGEDIPGFSDDEEIVRKAMDLKRVLAGGFPDR